MFRDDATLVLANIPRRYSIQIELESGNVDFSEGGKSENPDKNP